MAIRTVGFGPWETIPANTLMRLTISERAPLGFNLPGAFVSAAKDLYGQLYPRARTIPISYINPPTDAKAVVIDANLKDELRGEDYIARLESVGQRFAVITSAERLTGTKRTQATSEAGAQQRYEVAKTATAEAQQNSITRQIATALGVTAKTAMWIAIAIVAIIIWDKTRD